MLSQSEKIQYNSKGLDVDTGLLFYGARYYNPDVGRFITADTISGNVNDPQSLNKYTYTKNNPLKFVDPTGNEAKTIGELRAEQAAFLQQAAEASRRADVFGNIATGLEVFSFVASFLPGGNAIDMVDAAKEGNIALVVVASVGGGKVNKARKGFTAATRLFSKATPGQASEVILEGGLRAVELAKKNPEDTVGIVRNFKTLTEKAFKAGVAGANDLSPAARKAAVKELREDADAAIGLVEKFGEETANAMSAGMTGFLIGLGVFVALLLLFAFYIYTSLAWYTIAKKLKYKQKWLAWVPIARWAMILQMGGFHWAWVFLVLIPILGWIPKLLFPDLSRAISWIHTGMDYIGIHAQQGISTT